MCKPKFKKFNWFVKLITFNWPLAITLAPFGIYVNQKYSTVEDLSERTRNHEMIHWDQQLEMLIIFFYLWYILEMIVDFFIHGKAAYKNSTFEREAFDNDDNLDYRKTRKHFSQFKYLKKK